MPKISEFHGVNGRPSAIFPQGERGEDRYFRIFDVNNTMLDKIELYRDGERIEQRALQVVPSDERHRQNFLELMCRVARYFDHDHLYYLPDDKTVYRIDLPEETQTPIGEAVYSRDESVVASEGVTILYGTHAWEVGHYLFSQLNYIKAYTPGLKECASNMPMEEVLALRDRVLRERAEAKGISEEESSAGIAQKISETAPPATLVFSREKGRIKIDVQ